MTREDNTHDLRHTPRWYALYTRPRFEKKVDLKLREKGLESYLPLHTVRRRWSDRWKNVKEPLFSCYVFVRIAQIQRIYAVQTHGVVRLVAFSEGPAPIPDHEIEAIKRILEGTDSFETNPYLTIGQMVKVIHGPLEGIQGRLVERRGRKCLIVGIEQIKQSISVEIGEHDVQPIENPPKHQSHAIGFQ
ncbi:MAG: UpxY family transcription antiterminator [bacterium]